MLKNCFKLEPQLVKCKSKLNCMYQGLQIGTLIKNLLFVTPEILVQRQPIFHSTNCQGNIRRYQTYMFVTLLESNQSIIKTQPLLEEEDSNQFKTLENCKIIFLKS